MNDNFGPGLDVSSSPLQGGDNSRSSHRLTAIPNGIDVHRSQTPSYGSGHSERIQPQPSHHGHTHTPAPVGTTISGKGKWMVPLCHEPENDVSTCCLGWWCPQVLYGRTQFRLRQMAQNKDPLDLTDNKVINGPCGTIMLVHCVTNFACK
jgi:hypothetical protein